MTKPEVLEQIERMFVGRVPHNAALGLRMRTFGQRRAATALPWAQHLVGDPHTDVLHGGAITAAIDATCGAAVFAAMRLPNPIATLDLRIDYLRAAAPPLEVICEATCDKITRHVAFVRALAHQGDVADPVATAAATFMVFGGGGKVRGGKRPLAPDIERGADEHVHVHAHEHVHDRGEMAAVIAGARAAGTLDAIVGTIPYARFLGLSCAIADERRITTLDFRPDNVGNAELPALHGGTLGALLESAAIFEVLATHEAEHLPRTINLTIDYLRSARPVATLAAAKVTRAGRRVATVQAHAWQDDEHAPVATALVHMLLAR